MLMALNSYKADECWNDIRPYYDVHDYIIPTLTRLYWLPIA